MAQGLSPATMKTESPPGEERTDAPLVHLPKSSKNNLNGSGSASAKVSSILSTSYSDTEFREALNLLDKRNLKNDARTRRQIRLDFQKEVIGSNGDIINEFGFVAEHLRQIGRSLHSLNTEYEAMKVRIATAHNETSEPLSESRTLLDQREQIKTKQEVLAAITDHFVMTDDEIAALTATAEPVDERFFDAFFRARNIKQDCELLLGFEKQTLGLQLMEQVSNHINLGFQKLYKWVQREFRTLNLENPQMSSTIRRALRALAERPSLFQNCLDFFAESRERILSESFEMALTGATTQGVSNSSVKPIDLTAHDPLRYVGDMLAWIHSSAVSEREALEILFVAEGEELVQGLKAGRDTEVWRLVSEDSKQAEFNAVKALHELVDRDISGAARILRQRVEQVVQANEEAIPSYKLATLINFYRITFRKLLGKDSHLLECIENLESEAIRQFRSLLRDQLAAVQGDFQHITPDLSTPPFFEDCLSRLEVIITTYESSLASTDEPNNELGLFMGEAFEPFMSGCENMARSVPSPEDKIFLVNCQTAAAEVLQSFTLTENRAAELQEAVRTESMDLIESQYQFFRDSSGLSKVFRKGFTFQSESDLKTLGQASHDLDNFLPSALMDGLDRLKLLRDTAIARTVTVRAADRFCDEFEILEKAISVGDHGDEDTNGGDSLRAIFPRTTAEIRVLLS